jgi:hypothetical protein
MSRARPRPTSAGGHRAGVLGQLGGDDGEAGDLTGDGVDLGGGQVGDWDLRTLGGPHGRRLGGHDGQPDGGGSRSQHLRAQRVERHGGGEHRLDEQALDLAMVQERAGGAWSGSCVLSPKIRPRC